MSAFTSAFSENTPLWTQLNLPPRTDLISARYGDSVLGMEIIEAAGVYSFKAKTGTDLIITGYDMGSIAIPGWKYKSAATVDVFGETAVPVVSMFQNYNYGNQFFCKHKARVLHPTLGYELFDASVMEIVAYSEPLTGDDLVKANTYFGVPIKLTSAVKYVDVTATSSTETGTEAQPYKSLTKADATATAGDTIYIKSGTYAENSLGLGYFRTNKTLTYQALSKVVIDSTGASRLMSTIDGSPTFKNCILGSATNAKFILSNTTNATTLTFDTCFLRFPNSTAASVITKIDTQSTAFTNCVVVGPSASIYNNVESRSSAINSCYFKNIQLNLWVDTTITNCRFDNDLTNNVYSNNVNVTVLGGDLAYKIAGISHSTLTGSKTFDVRHVNFTNIGSVAANVCIALKISKAYSLIANYNSFSSLLTSHVSAEPSFIAAANCTNNEIEGNTSYSATNGAFSGLGLFLDGSVQLQKVHVRNNYMHSESLSGITLGVGSEVAYADKILDCVVTGNRVIGSLLNYPGSATTTHSLFVTSGINFKVAYNKIEYSAIGIVLKSLAQTYTAEGIYYNIINNSRTGIYLRGVSGTNVYNNTIINTLGTFQVGIRADENSAQAGTQECSNIIIKNNIIQSSTGTGNLIQFDAYAGSHGCIAENNQLFGGQYLLADGTNYSDLATAQAANKLLNCVVGDPSLNASLVPTTPISGADLGADYDDGLDTTSTFGSPTTLPVIVTKQQPATWQKGAFIQ